MRQVIGECEFFSRNDVKAGGGCTMKTTAAAPCKFESVRCGGSGGDAAMGRELDSSQRCSLSELQADDRGRAAGK
jgi:hypothetical protein